MDTATIQIQLDSEKIITNDEMGEIEAACFEACSRIEKLGYIRANVYKNNEVWNAPTNIW
jgi:hypothetical protein